jgi:hypothetical protein
MSPRHIFLCHSSNDKQMVRRIARDLLSYHLPVWFDEWEIKVGDSIHEKINRGIGEAAWLVVALSKSSVTSAWVQRELSAAFMVELRDRRVVVLPALLEHCDVPPLLLDKRYADFSKSYDEGIDDLLGVINADPITQKARFERLMLSAVAADSPVTTETFHKLHHTVHSLQQHFNKPLTMFPGVKAGDILTADHMNKIFNSIADLRTTVGLSNKWEHYPVVPNSPLTASMFNELLGKANQVVGELLRTAT